MLTNVKGDAGRAPYCQQADQAVSQLLADCSGSLVVLFLIT